MDCPGTAGARPREVAIQIIALHARVDPSNSAVMLATVQPTERFIMTTPSDNFLLENWKITLPVDSKNGHSGTAKEVKNLIGYEDSRFFYDASDGAMVFKADVDGATTSGSKYARTELREMDGTAKAAWDLAEGGTLSATLKVDETPIKDGGDPGRVVVGQIHGQNDELVRLYYEDGKVYFMNDQAGPDDKETKFTFKSSDGEQPDISLHETFSYMIDAHKDKLTVKVLADGQEYVSKTNINDVWDSDTFYFKAGVYLGVNESTGHGEGQVSFYGLDFSHDGGGMGGWNEAEKPIDAPVAEEPVEEEPVDYDNPPEPPDHDWWALFDFN
jgi:Alginate lyase